MQRGIWVKKVEDSLGRSIEQGDKKNGASGGMMAWWKETGRILSRATLGNALKVSKCFGQERKLEEEEKQASQGRVSVFLVVYNLSSVQFSCSFVSKSLWPHGLQHARLPCPSPTPGACSNSCPLSQWCHPTILSSVVPFSSCLQFFPASGSFPTSQFFTSGGQSIGVSASATVLPMTIQYWFPLGWTVGSPGSPRDSQESFPTPQFKSIDGHEIANLSSYLLHVLCLFSWIISPTRL